MDTTSLCPQGVEKKPKPQKVQAINCPRCNSTNTKFCYYNNYSLSQPRYFCKTCRRYWTEGGCLRNVPVGGGSRKNKRPSSSSSSKINKAIVPNNYKNNQSPPNLSLPDQNPNKIQSGHDLNQAYNPSHYDNIGMSEFISLPFGVDGKNTPNPSFSNHLPVMGLFKTGNIIGPDPVYSNSSGFPVLSNFYKPSLGFSVDGLENEYGNLHGVEDNNMILPLGQVSNSGLQQFEQDRAQGEANGFWNGMLAGGSSW